MFCWLESYLLEFWLISFIVLIIKAAQINDLYKTVTTSPSDVIPHADLNKYKVFTADLKWRQKKAKCVWTDTVYYRIKPVVNSTGIFHNRTG